MEKALKNKYNQRNRKLSKSYRICKCCFKKVSSNSIEQSFLLDILESQEAPKQKLQANYNNRIFENLNKQRISTIVDEDVIMKEILDIEEVAKENVSEMQSKSFCNDMKLTSKKRVQFAHKVIILDE